VLLDGLKSALLTAEAAVIWFVVSYTAWTLPARSDALRTLRQRIAAPGGWWHNAAGTTMVLEALLLFWLFFLLTIAGFWTLSLYTDEVLSWVEVALIGLTAVVLAWRTLAFRKIHRKR
jgi:hypothetical protein